MQFRDLKKQYQVLKEDINAAMIEVATDCNFIGGNQVKELEKALAEYAGVKHCITCANGTDALKIAEQAIGIGRGDAVFVPDFTFFSSAETIAAIGATPVFVDVEKETFNISPLALEKAIKKEIEKGEHSPKAIVAVDLFGLCANYDEILAIAQKYNLLVVEDAAQGFGGSIRGKRACSFGDIATTSFFPAKPLGCYGDGGAIFTDDDEIAALVRSLCVHGKSGNDKYNNIRIGYNSRLDTIQAAVLDVKLNAFKEYELDGVNNAADWYTEAINQLDVGIVTPVVPEGFYSSWAQYTLILPENIDRGLLQVKMKEYDIPTMVYYPKCMHQQGAFESIGYKGECPNAEMLCQRVLSLPMHPYLDKETCYYVVERLDEVINQLNVGD